ncbi:MAG: S-methyl-5-thioribose-1-phosphate isomerase, partial [Betaproteobacteria bacterium]
MANDFPGSPQSASSRWHTLAWRDGVLELIDQRALPGELKYFSCNDAGDTAYAIRNMVVRGAPAIGCAAAYGVALEAMRQRFAPADLFMQSLIAAFQLLADSRPTAVNLMWALDRQRRTLDAVTGAPPAEIVRALVSEANAILAEDIEVNLAIGRHGAALIPDGARILTHCNAGALATA